VTILGIEYDDATRALVETVQRADALAGTRGNANLQASVAAGMQAAGEDGGAEGILGLGIAAGSVGISSLMQPQADSGASGDLHSEQDLVGRLEGLKRALDAGLIDKDEYDKARARALGLA
jgi:membrane protease subunit (stomatin/prohibitin family)